MSANIYEDFVNELIKDPARLDKFMRKLTGPPHTKLAGKEYDEVNLMLSFLEPYKSTNNQQAWTDHYKIGDIEYRVTSWSDDEPVTIDEYLPEENTDKY